MTATPLEIAASLLALAAMSGALGYGIWRAMKLQLVCVPDETDAAGADEGGVAR